MTQVNPNLMHAFQAAAAGGTRSSNASANKSLDAAMIGETLPRGRGVDERAMRATAEVRKKAAARGLLVRPQGIPVQSLPPLEQLLNIINSGKTTNTEDNGVANGANKEANCLPSHDSTGANNEHSSTLSEEQTPVGLGKGLTSLDAKKEKSKPKADA